MAQKRPSKPKVTISEKSCPECGGMGFKETMGGLIQRQCPVCLGISKIVKVKDSSGHEITGKDRKRILKEIVKRG